MRDPSAGGDGARGVSPLAERQTGRSLIRIGRRVKLKAEVDVTPIGLLGIAGLASGILLSTTVLVVATIRASRGR